MMPLISLGIVLALWFLIGRFLSRKSKSKPIGYSVGLLAALVASIPFIWGTSNVVRYFLQRSAHAAGFTSIYEHGEAQRLGYSSKEAYDRAQAELAKARRLAAQEQRQAKEAEAARARGAQRVSSQSATSLEREIRSLLGTGRSMDRGDAVACGVRMRALQPQAEALQARAKALADPWAMVMLGTAANRLYFCVSCNPQMGPEYCASAEATLKEFRQALN